MLSPPLKALLLHEGLAHVLPELTFHRPIPVFQDMKLNHRQNP